MAMQSMQSCLQSGYTDVKVKAWRNTSPDRFEIITRFGIHDLRDSCSLLFAIRFE